MKDNTTVYINSYQELRKYYDKTLDWYTINAEKVVLNGNFVSENASIEVKGNLYINGRVAARYVYVHGNLTVAKTIYVTYLLHAKRVESRTGLVVSLGTLESNYVVAYKDIKLYKYVRTVDDIPFRAYSRNGNVIIKRILGTEQRDKVLKLYSIVAAKSIVLNGSVALMDNDDLSGLYAGEDIHVVLLVDMNADPENTSMKVVAGHDITARSIFHVPTVIAGNSIIFNGKTEVDRLVLAKEVTAVNLSTPITLFENKISLILVKSNNNYEEVSVIKNTQNNGLAALLASTHKTRRIVIKNKIFNALKEFAEYLNIIEIESEVKFQDSKTGREVTLYETRKLILGEEACLIPNDLLKLVKQRIRNVVSH